MSAFSTASWIANQSTVITTNYAAIKAAIKSTSYEPKCPTLYATNIRSFKLSLISTVSTTISTTNFETYYAALYATELTAFSAADNNAIRTTFGTTKFKAYDGAHNTT